MRRFFEGITASGVLLSIFGSSLLAFGLYNVHAVSGITEGGILGLTLFLEHWFHVSPSISGFILNVLCYAIGWKLLGRKFLIYSSISAAGFSTAYGICELFPPVFPGIADMPWVATVVGALFVGVSAGICVRIGGAPGGDDALAMSLSHLLHVRIERIYLFTDLIVLLMSLSYIPFRRIGFSLITVILSGQIIGWVVRVKLPRRGRKKAASPEKKVEADLAPADTQAIEMETK